ncbi:MAG TPA: amino acid adenylation domain-containing protein, partial [Pyrinomonadaceae bacterium]|nr:amino acid adenylation domain-containing protein [Pyrinomonadaceae bacterium]
MVEHAKCIHELFEAQADATPNAIAVVFEELQLTYRELDERATRLADELRRLGVAAETPVTICVNRSLEMVVGVLAILKAGGCYVPLDPAYPAERLAWMIEDTAAPVLLTEKSLLPGLPQHRAQVLLLDEPLNVETGLRFAPVSSDQLANVLYTSGSTGRPKGAAMSHRSLVKVVEWQWRRLQCGSGTRTAQFASLSFDVSFLEMFSMLCFGGTVVLLSEAVRQDPVSLWNCLVEEQIEILFVPFVGLQQLAQVALTTETRPSQLREIASSGEQLHITPAVVRLFEILDTTALDNLYGPTESHAAMEFRLEGPPDSWPKRPPIGRAIVHSEIYLLDENLDPISSGVDGEIYIGGHGLARGYLRRPDLTAERFLPDPFSGEAGARMYRTGDSARYLPDGVLEFTGRIDNQLKIRGFRVEPEEVEAELNRHAAIRNAVVAGWSNGNGEQRLAAYFVTEAGSSVSTPTLRRYLESKLPEYMVPAVFIPLEVLPLSPNGKLDRRALPLPAQLSRSLDTEFVAPRNELEQQLAEIWTDVLGLDEIGINDNFFELGGHSLLAATLLTRLREATGSALTMRRLFESPTVAELAQAISAKDTFVPGDDHLPELTPDPLNWNEPFPLADMQQAYWIGRSGAFDLGQVATHLYLEIESATVSVERVEIVVDKLVQRHPMLRAVILPDGQQQVLASPAPYRVRVLDLQGLDEAESRRQLDGVRQEMSHQVLPANEWPWFEVRASRLDDSRVLFHVGYDLLIGDLGSMQLFIGELTVLLQNPEAVLPELKVSFRDYVLAEAALQDLPEFVAAKAYWQERLETMPPPPELPLACHPSTIVDQRFVRRAGRLEPDAWQKLQARARQNNVTPTVVLLTAYAEIVNAWSTNSRFTINLPIQNRLPLHPQIKEIAGEFSSLSLLAIDNSEPASFAARAQVVQKQLWEDLSHRHYSGTRVMREWSRRYSGTSSAVMPIVFTSALNLESSGWLTGGAEQVVYASLQTPQVWLDNQVGEHGGALNFNWDAVDGLFPAGMFDGMFDAYRRLLGELAERDETWSRLDLEIAPAVPADPSVAPISQSLLHELFLDQARRTPQRPAVITKEREVSYADLDRFSSAIAGKLCREHTGNSKLVAIVMDKGWEQIAAALGILRAGLAYVPIDPQLPESRRLGLLKDAAVEVVLTQSWLVQSLNWPGQVSVLNVDEDDLSGDGDRVKQSATELAYVIYTSGSTGFPKGVMIDHRGAVNTILDINRRFNVTASDRVLGLSSLSFDLSVYDIFGTLAVGGAIVLPAPDQTRDPSSWVDLLQKYGVTIWDTVPALMEMLVEYLEHSETLTNKLRLVMLSGDWIPVSLPRRIKRFFDDAELFSLGGATEASIWSILHRIEDEDSSLPSIPYGRSMTNQSVQVLNEALQRCPAWVAGDLFIGGAGVAQGYWHDDEKTRVSFITHPNGERLYRTGDIGRYLPNGEIEFLGRRDLQVKVQGFRIELGEIEATLLQYEIVRSAVVAVVGDTSFEKRLVAFIVVEDGLTDPITEIREFLRARLATHMVPAEFNVVDEIPITANGKVDRKALFARQASSASSVKGEVAPALALTDTEKVLAAVFAELLGIENVDTQVNFFDLGVTSLHIVRAHNRLRTMLAGPIPIIQFFKYPTIKSLAANLNTARRPPQEVGRVAAVEGSLARSLATSSDIAVIGMSCRFPGARNVNEFLRNLRNGVESMSQFSEEELLESGISPQLLRRPDYVKAGSVLEGIDEFDAAFFGISPREAEMTDPQQRIFLETAWEALEDAGYDPQQYRGSIGVFAGANLSTYLLCNFNTRFANTIPGLPLTLANDKDYLATRVSYKLNLRGPSLTVQTACSTSLVAIHVACQNLLTGDCDLALAGGITINVPHKTGYQYQAGGPVSPDGHCRPFDAQAQGTVLGNGAGIVVLKRLDDAVRDNDRIVAVIKGSAINNDGAGKVGFTAPSVDGQTEVIAKALQRADVMPDTIGYVETHGTATLLGDPIEIEALSRSFASEELRPSSCAIGSVKSNLGHLDSAAGVAGFIKTALSLQHAELFPSLNYSTPNPQIEFEHTPFYVNTDRRAWVVAEEGKRRAGVSSFGIGGTNAHVVLEEWREEGRGEEGRDGETGGRGDGEMFVLPLAARDAGALRELAARYVERLAGDEGLRDLCYSASVRRAHHRERVAVVGRTAGELRAQLEAFLSGEATAGVFSGRAASGAGVVYVFSGQGAQWWGMGRELAARVPEFRASLAECDELLWQRTQEWRLLEELERGAEETRLEGEEIELTQCALFALQVSLARLWSSYGVKASAVVGHSMGEVAAAVAAGVLSLAEGVEVIYERSRLLREASGRGVMAAVELSEAEAAAVTGCEARVSVAAVNGKRASVVSGEREAVQRLVKGLEARGVMTRELRSSGVAGHSAQVEDISEELVRVLGPMRGRNSEVRLVSTVTGRAVAGAEVDASYWGRNVREPVRFRAAMEELARLGEAVYVEMNAHPVLGLWVREAVEEEDGKPAVVVAALRRERSEVEVTLTGLAELYAAGVSINWEAVWRGRAARYVNLPSYPWQRRRFWIEPRTPRNQSQIITEADLEVDPQRNQLVDSLIQKWGREGVLAVNRRYLAPFIFLSRTQQSLFYFNLKNHSLVGLMYVGPDDQYGALVKELSEYCQSRRYQLNLIATESGTTTLTDFGFSTTPCGALQSIADLKNFTLDGNRMRRLRYLVQRYQPGSSVKEYRAGSEANIDDDICNLIDDWIETRKKRVPFSARLKEDIRRGRIDPRLRIFLTYSSARLDSVVLISPAVAANGYLLDLEFYRENGAQGCLEFTIVEIIRILADEGRAYLSLGGSFGTQLNPHPNADREVEQLFATLHDEQILNGDGNFQFKSKFRPETSQLYLCLPKNGERAGLAEVLMTLAGDGAGEEDVNELSLKLKTDAAPAQHPTRRSTRSLHPLLGEKLHLALNEEVFQSYQSIDSLSFLGDHVAGGIVMMPGTAYIEMGLAAADHALGPGSHSLVDLAIQQVMAFPEPNTETTVQLTLKREDGGASFRILSEGDSGQWLLHATGTIRQQSNAPVETSLEVIRSRCTEEITGDAFYELLRRNSLEYGPSFQGVKHVWRRDREALGQVQLPESLSAETRNYRIHPALLDACFQVFEATIDVAAGIEDTIYLLRGAEEVTVYGELPKRIWAHAVLRDADKQHSDLYAGDLMLYGESERPLAQVKGIYAKRATRNSLVRNTQKHLSDWLYEIRWQVSNGEKHGGGDIQPRAWVIFCDDNKLGRNLDAKLRATGQPCLLVHP